MGQTYVCTSNVKLIRYILLLALFKKYCNLKILRTIAYIRIHARTPSHKHTHKCICKNACIHMRTHVHKTRAHTRKHTLALTLSHSFTLTRTYICSYARIYSQTHTHKHAYTRVCILYSHILFLKYKSYEFVAR